YCYIFFFQAEDGIRDYKVTGVQTCALPILDVAEQKRLNDAREAQIPWKKWGPYLSERQWGTVREDYSEDGNAWDYFTHDEARSRSEERRVGKECRYRWSV